MPAHVSNFTDFAPLAAEPDVSGFWASAEGCKCWGTDILDPLHMESPEERTPGLGLLELSTTPLSSAKTLINVRRASTPLPFRRRL